VQTKIWNVQTFMKVATYRQFFFLMLEVLTLQVSRCSNLSILLRLQHQCHTWEYMNECLYILNIWHFLPSFHHSHINDVSCSGPKIVLIFCYCHTPIARIDLSSTKSLSRLRRTGTHIAVHHFVENRSWLLKSRSHSMYNADDKFIRRLLSQWYTVDID